MADQTQIFLVFLIARNSHRKSSTKNLFLKIGQDSLVLELSQHKYIPVKIVNF